jgi:hypothetical protein
MKNAKPYYPGNKGADGVYHKIINLLPPHKVYWELFLGSGQILINKKPAGINVGIEVDSTVIQKFGHLYPRHSLIFSSNVFAWLDDLQHLGPDHLVYLDPPYPFDVRRSKQPIYGHELNNSDHIVILQALKQFRCSVAISSYKNTLYDTYLASWHKTTFKASTRGGVATECVYTNFEPGGELHQYELLGRDRTDRQRIKRKIKSWVTRINNMPLQERMAILNSIKQ